MLRGVMVTVVWIVAVLLVVLAIGRRVHAHRTADPVRVLRAWLPWVPDDFGDCAEIRTNRQVDGQVEVQVEIHAEPEQVRRFAKRNGFIDSDVNHGGMAVECWTLGDRAPAGFVVQMLLPAAGGPALITILGSRNPAR